MSVSSYGELADGSWPVRQQNELAWAERVSLQLGTADSVALSVQCKRVNRAVS